MRISLNWLRELVNFTVSPEELAETLTLAGFEVEDIEDRRQWANGVVVGQVLDCQPHPNADKLRVCQVDIGQDSPSNIVCGASNVRADIYVPVATLGTYLPKIDLKLKKTKLRGIPSEGMICSLSELGLEKESEGIKILSGENLIPGTDVRPLLGLDDVILDVTATANRADALSMVGVAREVAALMDVPCRLPEVPPMEVSSGDSELALDIANSKACPAYLGTVIEGVKIGPSPDWLKWRLQSAGVRPINNVVDVTNYILLEWGQPLHAFDRERLNAIASNSHPLTIGVRFAKEGESLSTLDEQTRSLSPQNLVITANDTPVAIAGVMGGKETEVYEGTQNIVLEAALFDPVTIRRSSRAQTLRTESSARYERGVNQAELDIACQRAIALLVELADGTPVTQAVADARPDWTRSIELRLERLNQLLGQVKRGDELGYILPDEVETILTALGCELEQKRAEGENIVWTVSIPPYRYRDLEREVDLIEEVARLFGYDRFCDTLPSKTQPGVLPFAQAAKNTIRQALRAIGLTEVVHYSLVKPEQADIVLGNPLFVEYSALRKDLLHGLIDAFEYNLSQGNGPLNAFEVGRVFWRTEAGLKETDKVAGILGGDRTLQGQWTRSGKQSPMTWYEAKGYLDSVFQHLRLSVEYQHSHEDERLHPGRTASLWVQGERLGIFGQLHPQLRSDRSLPDEVYVFSLDLDVLLKALDQDILRRPRFSAFSTYPAVERDLAFFAPTNLTVAELERVMKKAGGKLLSSVEVFDEYRGQNVPEGQRSLAFSLAYQAGDRTLTDTEVEPVHQKIRDALVDKFNVSLRS
ncbi:MAG: phenylalanine--tRNA ligase subunit beta [Chroococcales cyanobacterium]